MMRKELGEVDRSFAGERSSMAISNARVRVVTESESDRWRVRASIRRVRVRVLICDGS